MKAFPWVYHRTPLRDNLNLSAPHLKTTSTPPYPSPTVPTEHIFVNSQNKLNSELHCRICFENLL